MPHWGRQGPERSPQRRSVMRGRSQESQLTSSQSPCPWRMSLRFYVQSFPALFSSALLGPLVSKWVPSAVSWLVNYTLRQRNRRGPGGPRNSRHRSEADWKLRRNFNCTTGNAVITSIIFIALPLVLSYWEDGFTQPRSLMIRHPKQQPDINCCDNYSSCCCANIYYYHGRSVLGLGLCIWHVVRFTHGNTRKHRKQTSRKYGCVVLFFLMRFRTVHQDGSDPSFSSITQRLSSESSRSRGAPNVRRKPASTGQS